MRSCAQQVSWHLATQFSKGCPVFADCVEHPSSHSSTCDCANSEFFLVNHAGKCSPSAFTFVAAGFWAALGLVCVLVAVRMWRYLRSPQPRASFAGAPTKARGRHFERCKWVNLCSIACTMLWCFVRAAMIVVVPQVGGASESLVVAELACHALLVFTFVFSVLEHALMLIVVVLCTNRFKSLKFGASATQQMLFGASVAALVLFLITVPQLFHLPWISAVILALVLLALAYVFNTIIHKLRLQHSNNIVMVSAMQQLTTSFAQLASMLGCCVVVSFSLAIVELVAQFAPTQPGLCVGLFFTKAAQHVCIIMFQFLVTQLAVSIHTKRRHSRDESQTRLFVTTHTPSLADTRVERGNVRTTSTDRPQPTVLLDHEGRFW